MKKFTKRSGSAPLPTAHPAFVEQLEARTLFAVADFQPLAPVVAGENAAPTVVDLSTAFGDPAITGTVVRIDTSEGSISVQLADQQTPQTVANFLSYVTSGAYSNTLIHRSANLGGDESGPKQIIQGGGYSFPSFNHITQNAPVVNEPGISNTPGTIAMAKGSDPNSATSEWYFNVTDNSSSLDDPNNAGGFTAFGHIIGAGMNVVNTIAAIPTFNGGGAFTDIPLINFNGSGNPTAQQVVLVNDAVVTPLVPNASNPNSILTLTATSSVPSLVTPTIANGGLTLTYGAGKLGTATIDLHAVDVDGSVADQFFTVTVNPTPGDLTAIVATHLPSAVIGGSAKQTVSAKLVNLTGGTASGRITTAFYLSTDQTLDSSDTLVAATTTSVSLGAGKSKTVSAKFTYPAALPDGQYFLLADADSTNVVAEANETNNVGSSTTAVTVAAPFRDLTDAMAVSLAPITGGSKLTPVVSIHNSGNVATKAGTTITYFLSSDQTFDANDTLIGSSKASLSLNPGASKSFKASLVVPTTLTLPNGNYFLLAVADASNVVAETDETNNVASSAGTIAFATPFIDLSDALSDSGITSTILGGKLKPVVAITQHGNIPITANVTVAFFLSDDPLFDANDILVGGTTAKLKLTPGGSAVAKATITIPTTTTPGTYHLIAVIDPSNTLGDNNLSNNSSVTDIRFDVTAPA